MQFYEHIHLNLPSVVCHGCPLGKRFGLSITSFEGAGRRMGCINPLLSPRYFVPSLNFTSEFSSLWNWWSESQLEPSRVWSGSHVAGALKQPRSVPAQLCLVAFRRKGKLSASSMHVCIWNTGMACALPWETCPTVAWCCGSLILNWRPSQMWNP